MTKKYTKKEILAFLKNNPVMSMSISKDNKPMSSMVLYSINDDFNIHFVTHENTYKSQALTDNPQISFTVWEHNKILVQADGKTKKISDKNEIKSILTKVVESTENVSEFWPPVLRIKNKSPYVAFKIKLSWLRATDLTNKNMAEKEPPYTEITF